MNIERMQADARAAACISNVSIATRPAVWHAPGTEHAANRINWGLSKIIDFADEHGEGRQNLQAMAIYTYPDHGEYGDAFGYVPHHPQVFNNKIHFPVICIQIPQRRLPSEKRINRTMRHEIRHVMQDIDKAAPYQWPWARRVVRAAGALAMVYGAKHFIDFLETGDETDLWGVPLFGIAGAAVLAPGPVMNHFTPREIDARLFALRTRSFNPVRVLDTPRKKNKKPIKTAVMQPLGGIARHVV